MRGGGGRRQDLTWRVNTNKIQPSKVGVAFITKGDEYYVGSPGHAPYGKSLN